MNKLTDSKLIRIYGEVFDRIYPVVSDHIGDNRRFKGNKFLPADIDFSLHEAYAGALGDRYIVIDIDNKEGKDEGTVAWETLLVPLKLYKSLNVESPETFSHKTKSEGFHLFFKLPPGIDKVSLPKKLVDYVEVKTLESYIAGSYVEIKGKGGTYTVHTTKDVMELPSSLLGLMLKKTNVKKDATKKKADLLEEVNSTGEYEMGDNTVNWDNISYEEIKARMFTVSPDTELNKWLHQLYLFITVYKHLQYLGHELNTTCEDVLIEWSAKGVNSGNDDPTTIRNLIKGFDSEKNQDKLLPENNYLISEYNSSTNFESYAKFLTEKIYSLKKKGATSRVIANFIEEGSDRLANELIKDIINHRECFMINKENKTGVITLMAFTVKNRWEKIISNATSNRTKDPIVIETLFAILSKDGQTLYSKNLRVYSEFLFPDIKMLGKFGDKMLLKIKTSLYNIDLSPRRMPLDCDIMGFKNTAIKLQKQAPHVIAISWEQVRSHRLTEEIYMSTQSSSSEDFDHFINNGIIFDTTQLRTDREKLIKNMYLFFAPMFWDFSIRYKGESYEEFKAKIEESTAERIRTFFACAGKTMLRYKKTIVPLFLILSGDKKAQDENGANGKSFIGQSLLPALFGRSKIANRTASSSEENKDKFTEASMKGFYLKVMDDSADSKGGDAVSIKHLIKEVGYRPSADIRPMHGIPVEVEMFYDIIFIANNVKAEMSSDGGNARRIKKIVFHNTNKRCGYGRKFDDVFDMLADHKELSEEFLSIVTLDGEDNTIEFLEEKRIAYINKALNEAYVDFFTSSFIKSIESNIELKDNIYFSYLTALDELFGASLPEVNTQQQTALKTQAFIYLIELGNQLLKAGSFDAFKGFEEFEIKDKGTPLRNILTETVKCHETLDEIGLLVEKRNLLSFLASSLLLDANEHRNEITSFVNKLPELDVCRAKDGRIIRAVNLQYIELGVMMSKIAKEGSDKIKAKFNTKILTKLQTELMQEEDCSPFKSFDNDIEPPLDKFTSLLYTMKLRVREELVVEYFEKNSFPTDNNWLRLRR